jgi:hypothetical protein
MHHTRIVDEHVETAEPRPRRISAISTLCPRATPSFAVAAPMPLAPPVMRRVLGWIFFVLGTPASSLSWPANAGHPVEAQILRKREDWRTGFQLQSPDSDM